MKWKKEKVIDVLWIGCMFPFCMWSSLCHEGLLTKCQKSMFCSKMHNFDLILKIFVGYIEEAFRCPYIKYLSNWMI